MNTPSLDPKPPSSGAAHDGVPHQAPGHVTFWSATPTPLTATRAIDVPSVERMIDWHVAHQIAGVMVLGTCGEGPWIPDEQRRELIRESAQAAGKRLIVAAQVSDNSPARVLEQIDAAAQAGADYAVVAQPYFALKSRPPDFQRFYHEIFERSALPMGFYDRGQSASVPVPQEALAAIAAHPRVHFIKDSSGDPERGNIYLRARRDRPDLIVMTGNEFRSYEYLTRGYSGLMLGGAIINARYVQTMVTALAANDASAARAADLAMQTMLRLVYGGTTLSCWLAGLKYLLVRLGVFSTTANYLDYELSDSCRHAIDSFWETQRERFIPATRQP